MPEQNYSNIWVVTDIDGTLMDHQYDLTPALDTISLLRENKIPIILCTSKTAAEVRKIRLEIGNIDPFIVENGGAVYGKDEFSEKEWEIVLGRSFADLKLILDKLSNDIDFPLKALNDLSYKEINKLTGLDEKNIELALDRHWSVPFINPPENKRTELYNLIDKYKINIYQGNRMSHLLDSASHKGNAVLALKRYYNNFDVKIIALGDSPNDLPLLEVADIPIVIPGINGPNISLLENINNKEIIVAKEAHSKGWAIEVKAIIGKYIS